MFTKISSLTLAVLLFVVLWGTAPKPDAPSSTPYALMVSIVVLIFAAFALNFKRLNFTWPHLLLPTTYILSVASVFVVIASPSIRVVFLILAALIFYFLEIKLGKESHFLQNIYLLTIFALYLGMFAIHFYYHLSIYWILPAAFILSYLFAVQGFTGFSLPAKRYFYLLVALVCSESALGLALWPTHFFVNTVVLFCIFYLIWIFSFSAFFGRLSRQKVYWQVTLVAIVLLLTLSTAAWKPLS